MNRRRISKNLSIAVFFLCSIFYAQALAKDLKKEEGLQNPFGILEFLHWNHNWNNYKYPDQPSLNRAVALMKEAGVDMVRQDFLWEDIEPRQGEFDFRRYDPIIETLSKNNMQILGILHYSVSWAAPGGQWNCPPQDNKLFVNYASKVIGRYKHKIKYWEVWNEPDSSTYWNPQDGLKRYCALLKDVYTAAKEIDPECKILNGGLAGGLAGVHKLYDNGAKDYFDILNIHIFQSPLLADSIKAVTAYAKLAAKVMSKNGDGHKKIWVTEIGCPGVKKGLKVKNWWQGKNPDESEQAAWLKLVYTELLKDKNVEKIFWAFFRDCNGHWDNGTDYFGLVRWDFSPKPSYKAYKSCFKQWEKSR